MSLTSRLHTYLGVADLLTRELDSHFRIGGAKGSGLTAADCPKRTGEVNQNCIAGSMLLHMTSSSSGYLENVWAWVADHDFDSGPAQTQIDVYVARGMLLSISSPDSLLC